MLHFSVEGDAVAWNLDRADAAFTTLLASFPDKEGERTLVGVLGEDMLVSCDGVDGGLVLLILGLLFARFLFFRKNRVEFGWFEGNVWKPATLCLAKLLENVSLLLKPLH